MKPAIVVVAYNRAKSLKRILYSISKGNYSNLNNIELIISIDRGNNDDVLNVANEFIWEYGTKTVIYQESNLGLRAHILKCGALTKKYGSIILLEDDLYVSPEFYKYACQALEFSVNKEYIGGISLYNHKINVLVNEPFTPNEDGYDNWYFQLASSWGQAWSETQWDMFIEWYEDNKNRKLNSNNFPEYISNWPETSWLKYYTKYLVENDRYFLYPKVSFSTNFSDKGTHVGTDNTDFQVPLQMDTLRKYKFSKLSESNSLYDVYFENKMLAKHLDIKNEDICIDLYGYKTINDERFYLTRKILDYKILKSYGCCFRPHDINIIFSMNGEDFFLYDTQKTDINNINKKEKEFRKLRYILKVKTNQQYISLIKMLINKSINRILKHN